MRAVIRLMSVPRDKRDLDWLKECLQAAIELEMSTIPPYLYATWSIDPDHDPNNAGDTIKQIAIEEMAHMGTASNLLVAIGGKPKIIDAAPKYPTQLPKDVHKGLTVELQPLSTKLLLNAFMAIEEPTASVVDDPDFTPSHTTLIGDFYKTVQEGFDALSPALSTQGQVDLSDFFGSPIIASPQNVRDAISLITQQGEGTSASPFEDPQTPGELAHFYQFGELFHGKRLTKAKPFTYSGDVLAMPTAREVLPAADDLPESKAFNILYSDMLRDLQRAWDGNGPNSLGDAIGKMFGLKAAAEAVIQKGFGPSFKRVDQSGAPVQTPTTGSGFIRVRAILDQAVAGGTFGAHGPFWRGKTRDQFVQMKVFGQTLLIVGNGHDSNLVKALRGQLPFGSDVGTAGAIFRRMPAGRPAVAVADVDFIEQWINDGCPDGAAADNAPKLSLTTGAFRPDPLVHVAFWRDFDDWAMYHATPDVQDAVGVVLGIFPAWTSFARDAAAHAAWAAALNGNDVRDVAVMLSSRQKQTLEMHYGVPVPLLTVLDGFERFGNDGLPDDPLRPGDIRHNMNGPVMWFVWSSFAEACIDLNVSTEFWLFYMRAILCGMLNDGLFRRRFAVSGFDATPEGRTAVFPYVQQLADASLPAELRRRFAESGLQN